MRLSVIASPYASFYTHGTPRLRHGARYARAKYLAYHVHVRCHRKYSHAHRSVVGRKGDLHTAAPVQNMPAQCAPHRNIHKFQSLPRPTHDNRRIFSPPGLPRLAALPPNLPPATAICINATEQQWQRCAHQSRALALATRRR